MILKRGFWREKRHYLNKMTLRELVYAYFQYYAIQAYLLVGVAATVVALWEMTSIWPLLASAAAAVAIYPVAWYLIHRFILHGTWLAKSPLTATVWKRIHYDHHQDPHDLEILFGALYTTLPTVAIATMPIGWLIGGLPGAMAALAGGVFTTAVYEFCHCIQHLSFKPKSAFLQRIKTLHMAHHFHNEQGNYGITNYLWDRLLGTFYTNDNRPPKSDTVFNLGYDAAMAEKYPWVARRSELLEARNPRERRRQMSVGQ